jgi:hypothetical protein
MEHVDPRTSLINALITLGVVAVLAFVGFVLRLSRGETVRLPFPEKQGAAVVDEQEVTDVDSVLLELEHAKSPKSSNVQVVNRQLVRVLQSYSMLNRSETDQFDELVDCKLLADAESTASRLRLVHKGKRFLGQLYFAEAVAPGSQGAVGDVGKEAMRQVEKLFSKHKTKVFSRWQPVEKRKDAHYYVMIQVEGLGGADGRFLSDILVTHGYADYRSCDIVLPDGKTSGAHFVQRLISLQQVAKAARMGAWQLRTVADR